MSKVNLGEMLRKLIYQIAIAPLSGFEEMIKQSFGNQQFSKRQEKINFMSSYL